METLLQKSLFGHYEIFDTFKNLYLNKKFPNKIILSGEKGIGKCTLAYHVINYILSLNEDHNYDTKDYKINSENKSFKLIKNKSNPNFNLIDVEDGKKNIDINQIRDLISNLNKSSFNESPRFVLIDNINLLNLNSVNALLKVIEEPNDNINFILINSNKRVLATLKSRCINFKISLSQNQVIEIANKIIDQDIYDLINKELINYYTTPGQLLRVLKISDDFEIDVKNLSLENFLSLIIKNKLYKKDKKLIELTYLFIEIYFRNKVNIKNIEILSFYTFFLKKIINTKIYNLDEESIFMEFEDRILNG
ncbi:AAA family ATPase [Candidatus Pelagibacter sp.]|nr:AAA family ATPase [Candidatus Pelagibacter sp.]